MNTQKLYRSSSDVWVGGVFGGLAEKYNVPSLALRIGFIIVALFTYLFPCLIAYVVMWIAVPERPKGAYPFNSQGRPDEAQPYFGGSPADGGSFSPDNAHYPGDRSL